MRSKTKYQPSFCEELLAFFNRNAFSVAEIQKRDGSISLLVGRVKHSKHENQKIDSICSPAPDLRVRSLGRINTAGYMV